jgi:hypothetical protein
VPKRGDRAAPPARKGEWTLIFHDGQSAEGWEELCSAAPGPMLDVWRCLSRDPRDRRANPDRVHRLQGDLSTRDVRGQTLEQWQHEVTGAGRVWYCPEDARRVVHITKATKGHPKETDR